MNKLKEFDLNLLKEYKRILGIDEVGRGCVAGPLVVVGLILKNDFYDERIQDSKNIKTIKLRKELKDLILKNTISYHIEIVDSLTVDKLNVKKATRQAMNNIATKLINEYDLCLTDFEKIENKSINQINLVKGDATSFSIACASIVAKSTRDDCIEQLHKKYPEYDFLNNQGYLTKKHKEVLQKYPPLKNIHRFSYKPIIEFLKIHEK